MTAGEKSFIFLVIVGVAAACLYDRYCSWCLMKDIPVKQNADALTDFLTTNRPAYLTRNEPYLLGVGYMGPTPTANVVQS